MRIWILSDGKKRPFHYASHIIDEAIMNEEQLVHGMPKNTSLISSVNRARAKHKPLHPTAIDFVVDSY